MNLDVKKAIAYIDGSYIQQLSKCSYGIVYICNGKEYYLKGLVSDPKLIALKNVGGELAAAKKTIELALNTGIKHLIVYYDYIGIAKLYYGQWGGIRAGTIAFRDYCRSIQDQIYISFRHIKSHSGNDFNDKADALAKAVLYALADSNSQFKNLSQSQSKENQLMPVNKNIPKTKSSVTTVNDNEAHVVAVENPCLLEKADTVNINLCNAKLSNGKHDDVIVITVMSGLHIIQTIMTAVDAKKFKDKFDSVFNAFADRFQS